MLVVLLLIYNEANEL